MLPIVMLDIYVYGTVNNMKMTWEECYKQYNNLCWKLVNKYKHLKLEPEERYNLALFGLWKAYNTYDDTRGASFMSHATNVIYQVFNLEYRDSNAKKRQHEIHLDINYTDDEGNRFEEILLKYNYSKRTAYTHISRGRDKFIKFLEEKDVLL